MKEYKNAKIPKTGLPEDGFQGELGEKGDPASPMTAWLRTNPNYSEKNIMNEAYSKNCQRNPFTYALQRRGYDVETLPTYKNDPMPFQNAKTGWPSLFKDPLNALKSVGGRTYKDELESINDQMARWGDGAIALVKVKWKGKSNGHMFVVERINGKNVFMDTQIAHVNGSHYRDVVKDRDSLRTAKAGNGSAVTNRDSLRLVNSYDVDITKRMSMTDRGHTVIARLDNAEFNTDNLKFAVNVRGGKLKKLKK